MAARAPTLLHAAAHRERALDLPVFDRLFASVSGFAHHTRAEQSLILNRTPAAAAAPQAVVGLPVERPEPPRRTAPAPESARRDAGLGDRPFALCPGTGGSGQGHRRPRGRVRLGLGAGRRAGCWPARW